MMAMVVVLVMVIDYGDSDGDNHDDDGDSEGDDGDYSGGDGLW